MPYNETSHQLDIIIPVYNTEQYLDRCIQSVVNQTFTGWRLLLVDDGSTDRSPQICDEWAARDRRIRVTHKTNSGQADSRNVALRQSTAELVGFVDSDDWIEPDMYATLIANIRHGNADIAICSHFTDTPQWSRAKKPRVDTGGETVVIGRDEAQRLVIRDRIQSYIWQMVFRRECLDYSMPDHHCFEDYAVLPHWFGNARRVAITTQPLYHYRMRKGSAVHEKTPEKEFAFFEAEQHRLEFFRDTAMRDDSARQMTIRCIRVAKYITRMKLPHSVINGYLKRIKQQLAAIDPAFSRQLSTKDRLLYCLLLHHTPLFIAYQKTEKTIMINKRKNTDNLFD